MIAICLKYNDSKSRIDSGKPGGISKVGVTQVDGTQTLLSGVLMTSNKSKSGRLKIGML